MTTKKSLKENKQQLLLSVIIPAYNEENTIEKVLTKVSGLNFGKNIECEIIIINDCSKDRTLEIANNFSKHNSKVKVFSNQKNLGKTQSVKKGILKSTGDYVVVQDADLEYDPEDLLVMFSEMIRKKCDVAYGNRFGLSNGVVYWQNFIGNIFLSFVSSLFTMFRLQVIIPDMEVCYKMIKGDVARKVATNITAKSNFGFEPEITARLSRYKDKNGNKLNFIILPISYNPRTKQEGKKIRAIPDGFLALWEIIKYNIF